MTAPAEELSGQAAARVPAQRQAPLPRELPPALRPNRFGRPSGSLLLTVASVLMTGVTNASPVVLIQLAGGSASVGVFATVTSPVVVAMTVQRLILAQHVLVSTGRRVEAQAVGLSLLLSTTACGFAALLAAGFGALHPIFLALLVFVPLQDALRFVLFGRLRPGWAAAIDAIWLLTSTVLVLLAWQRGAGEWGFAAAWAAGAAGSVAVGGLALCWKAGSGRGPTSAPGSVPLWALSAEAVVAVACGQLHVLGLSWVSVQTVGALRLAQTVLTPLAVAVSSTSAYTLPRMRGARRRGPLRPAALAAAVNAVLAAVLLGGALLVPPGWLRLVHIEDAHTLWLTLALGSAAMAVSAGNSVLWAWLKSTRAPGRWLPPRVLSAVVEPVVGVLLATRVGAPGAAAGMLCTHVALAVSGIWLLRGHRVLLRGHRARSHVATVYGPIVTESRRSQTANGDQVVE